MSEAEKLVAKLAAHIYAVTGAQPGSDSAELFSEAKAFLANHSFWTPIAVMPEELKDGRQVFLWEDGSATVASYVDYSPGSLPDGTMGNWHDDRGSLGHATVTHFAEIEPPEPPEDWLSEMIHLGV